MKHRRAAIEKKLFNHVQRTWTEFLEYSQTETLSDRRVNATEDGVSSGTFNPRCAAVRVQAGCASANSTHDWPSARSRRLDNAP